MGATEKHTQATQYFGYITISHHSFYITHTVRFAHARFARVSHPLFSRSALASLASLARFARSPHAHAPPLVGAYCPAMLPSSGLALARPEWVKVQRPNVVS